MLQSDLELHLKRKRILLVKHFFISRFFDLISGLGPCYPMTGGMIHADSQDPAPGKPDVSVGFPHTKAQPHLGLYPADGGVAPFRRCGASDTGYICRTKARRGAGKDGLSRPPRRGDRCGMCRRKTALAVP